MNVRFVVYGNTLAEVNERANTEASYLGLTLVEVIAERIVSPEVTATGITVWKADVVGEWLP